MDGRRGTGLVTAEERRINARNPTRVIDATCKTGEIRAEEERP